MVIMTLAKMIPVIMTIVIKRPVVMTIVKKTLLIKTLDTIIMQNDTLSITKTCLWLS